jgi:hypothetical protein
VPPERRSRPPPPVLCLVLLANSDARICNGDCREQATIVVARVQIEVHRAFVGDLDGIVRKIDQNLDQRATVRADQVELRTVPRLPTGNSPS